jgi:hypothetical protein
MELITKVLQEAGFSESQIAELQNPETDIEVIISEWRETNKQLVKTQNQLFTQDEVNNKFRNFSKKAIKNIARLTGVDLTDAQANEIAGKDGFEGFVGEAEKKLQERIAQIQTGSDESLKTQLNDLLGKTAEQQRLLDETRDQYENKLKEVESEWSRKLTQKEVDAKLTEAFTKIDWADKSRADVDKYFIRQKLDELGLMINPDGTVLRKDGTNALSISGKSIYKSVSSENRSENPLLDIAEEFNLVKRSNGGQGQQQQQGQQVQQGQNQRFDGAAAEMESRLKAKGLL